MQSLQIRAYFEEGYFCKNVGRKCVNLCKNVNRTRLTLDADTRDTFVCGYSCEICVRILV